MRKWKRLLLCLCAVLAIAVVFILLSSRGHNENAVSLSFVGFTNVPIALIRATNYGSVPIELDSAIRSENFWVDTNQVAHFANGFASPGLTGLPLPRILKSGGSSIIELWASSLSESWWTEIHCRRLGAWERAYSWAWNHSSPTVQRKLFRFIPAPKEFWVKAGPFTNQPPPVTIYEVHSIPAAPVDYRFGSPQFPPNNVDLIQTRP